jgi:putative endonuclease
MEFIKKKILGKTGEDIAKDYLEKKKLKFLLSNFVYLKTEIDLIFLDKRNKILIFVEVKTRRNKNYGEPEDSITKFKQMHIKKAAEGFLHQYRKYLEYDIRFDSVGILIEGDEIKINHIENSF